MIYGLNFNGTHIPPVIAKRFRERILIRIFDETENRFRHTIAILTGVCQTREEWESMRLQADNGHRHFHCVSRTIHRVMPKELNEWAKGEWYGFYVY